jgi:nitrogen fixation NifU-like protein
MHNLYREEILEHYHDPLHFGRLKKFDLSSKLSNPFCGDEIEVFVQKKKGLVQDVSFIGKGCAISIAASSMLTDFVKGKTLSELTRFTDKDMLDLLNIEVSETRKKCALLSLVALKDALRSEVKSQKSKVKNTILKSKLFNF